MNYGQCISRKVKNYRVEIDASARADMKDLATYLATNMSFEGAWRYKEAMLSEIQSLSLFADLYPPSRYADIRRYHPRARRMVSHNKRWVYIFHLEDDVVVLDRIRPSKMVTK